MIVAMKSKRHLLILGSAFVFVIAAIFLLSSAFGPQEPVHGGRPLRAWISELSREVALAEQTRRAEDATKQIGTNALPVILDELRVADDSALVRTVHEKYKYSRLARKGSLLRLPHQEPAVRRRQAADALRVLARPLGLTTLTNLLHDPNPHVQVAAAEALVAGFTVEGVEALLNALDSENIQVRLAALCGLPGAGYIPQEIAPLLRCLTDPNPQVRMGAASCLQQFSPVYRSLKIPGLIEGLETAALDVDPSVRAVAQQALAGIRPVVAPEPGYSK